jgi:hypothetical protein
MDSLRGLLYKKHRRIGTRSEGPDYYLQTAYAEYLLELNERDLRIRITRGGSMTAYYHSGSSD